MIRRLTLACVGFALCAAGAAQLFAAGPESAAALHATNYIRSLQNTDGGFPDGFSAGSSSSATLEAIFGFSAYGIDARTVENGGNGPDDYLASQAAPLIASAGGAAKLVAGLAAMDIDPASFGGVDVLASMDSNYDAATGKYGDDVFAQSLFMLAKAALGQSVPAASVDHLQSLQRADGGWEYCCGWGTDTNTTSLAVRALIAAGVPAGDPDIAEAIASFHNSQQADGGFPYAASGSSDPNSTAYVIQAIVAVGQSAEAGGSWDLAAGANPLAKLAGFQNPTTGALQYFGSDSPFATYQGVPALMLSAFPEHFDPDAAEASATATASPTPSPTATSSATATSSPTFTSTASPSAAATRARTPTSARTAIPSASAASVSATGPPISTVAGAVQLPNTGDRSGDVSARGLMMLALALSGVSLAAAGTAFLRKEVER